jgi:tRNA C32,U32 (ribose-2'-O)-methylase TrmJ
MPNTQNLHIHTLLVRPQYAKNIGQSIRATANSGFGKVHIINPVCEVSNEARKWAAGAQEAADQIQIYKDWTEFNSKHKGAFKIGLTRRTGKYRKLIPFETGLSTYYGAPTFNKELFLVYGPEDDGLNSEDIKHINMCCNLNLYGDFKSLNLSHAVMLTQHSAHRLYLESDRVKKNSSEKKEELMEFPDEALMEWLKSSGVQKSLTKLNTFDVLKSTILRSFPNQKELSTFEKAFRASVKSSKPL